MTCRKEQIFNDLFNECSYSKLMEWGYISSNIRNSLERFSLEERTEIVSRTRDGCAPLFIACKRGGVAMAEFLIKFCGADIEQKGEYVHGKFTYIGTPLWCASAEGKLGVVKTLVEFGANVHSANDNGSTPVRSACFDKHNEIVKYLVSHNADILKPNYDGSTCLMNAVGNVPLCEYLIDQGADMNAQHYVFLSTALHVAIVQNCFDTMKLLLRKGADPSIKNWHGDDVLQCACLKGAKCMFGHLCERVQYSKERIAEAHELIGSTFLEEHKDVEKTIHHWRIALAIRYDNPEERLKKKCLPRKAPYLNAIEFTTVNELENLVEDLDALHVQSLLVSERILGPLHSDMIYRLRYRGAAYADSSQYSRCIDLWCYALDCQLQIDSLLDNDICYNVTSIVQIFMKLHEQRYSGLSQNKIRFDDVFSCIRLLVRHFKESVKLLQAKPQSKHQLENFDIVLKMVSQLLYFMYVIPKSSQEVADMKCLIKSILKLDTRTSAGESLLHLVVSKSNTLDTDVPEEKSYAIFPDPGVIRLLLECGATTDTVNNNRQTPLHIALLNN